jgi:hypothetical protein
MCICLYCYIQILNFAVSKLCWWFKYIVVYLIGVFLARIFSFSVFNCGPSNIFVNFVLSFQDFWEVMCRRVSGSQHFAVIVT